MNVEIFFAGTVVGLFVTLVTVNRGNNSETEIRSDAEWNVDKIKTVFDNQGRGFEMLVAKYFSYHYNDVKVTQKSNDGGYDVVARNKNTKVIIEAKMTSGSVSVKTARALVRMGNKENADKVILVTTSDLSKPGKDHFRDTSKSDVSTEVINGNILCEKLEESPISPPWPEESKD